MYNFVKLGVGTENSELFGKRQERILSYQYLCIARGYINKFVGLELNTYYFAYDQYLFCVRFVTKFEMLQCEL